MKTIPQLDEHLALWTSEGVITAQQADLIRAEERRLVQGHDLPGRFSRAEPAAYLGGLLVLVALAMLAGQWWDDLSPAGRVGATCATALLLVLGGAAVPVGASPGLRRLQATMWALSTAAAAGALGVLAQDVWHLHGGDASVLVTAGAAVWAHPLWARGRHGLQLVVALGTECGLVAASLGELPVQGPAATSLPGLGVVLVAGAWLAAALRGVLRPRTPAVLSSGLAVALGSGPLQAAGWGRPLALLAVTALLAVAVTGKDGLLLAPAALGMLVVVPSVLVQWFPGRVAVPVAILLCGAVLLLAAVRAMRLVGRAR